MPVIKAAQSRRTETPNAVMTTLASPTLGKAGQAVWRVDMAPGQRGPLHGIDAEQIFAVLQGGATLRIGTEQFTVGSGDTVVIPADVPRQVTSDAQSGFSAIATGPASLRAYVLSEPEGEQHRAAPAGEKIVPAWVV